MTDVPGPGGSADLLRIAADDELITALAAGRAAEDDELTVLLARFRDELDDAYDAADLVSGPIPLLPARRAHRLRRGAAIGVVTVTVAASLTGVAAAVGGDSNPLHRAFTSIVEPHGDRSLAQARQLLRDVEERIRTARARGGITDPERTALFAALDRVLVLVADDSAADRQPIEARVVAARATLTALPPAPTAEPGDEANPSSSPEHPTATPTAHGEGDGRTGSEGANDQGSGDQGSGDRQSGDQRQQPTSRDGGDGSDTSGSAERSGDPTPTATSESGSGDHHESDGSSTSGPGEQTSSESGSGGD